MSVLRFHKLECNPVREAISEFMSSKSIRNNNLLTICRMIVSPVQVYPSPIDMKHEPR